MEKTVVAFVVFVSHETFATVLSVSFPNVPSVLHIDVRVHISFESQQLLDAATNFVTVLIRELSRNVLPQPSFELLRLARDNRHHGTRN